MGKVLEGKVKAKDKLVVEIVNKYLEGVKGVITASGIISDLGITANEIKDVGLYSRIKNFILRQSVGLPKHTHESIMEDFEQVFGDTSGEDVCVVKIIKKAGIDVADFLKEAEGDNK